MAHLLGRGGGAISLTNSTVSGNTAPAAGGISSSGTLNLSNSTLSGNTAPAGGGGVHNRGGTATLTNTIVANSPLGGDCFGDVTSKGHNLDGDGTCGLSMTGDRSNADPMLGPLQDNGGPTVTHALLPGSAATDAGDDGVCPATDQRGVARPQGLACDIGAFEYDGVPQEIPTCHGLDATILGTEGDDFIRGTPGADVIVGLGGDDVILGLGGNDTICAGPGEDVVKGGLDRDWISGGPDDDVILGGRGNDKRLAGYGAPSSIRNLSMTSSEPTVKV